MMSTRTFLLCVALVATVAVSVVEAATEPRTGISFPDTFKGSPLQAFGVRSKGPIKVYAVGQYDSTFLLKMSHGVNAEKMSSALADALQPRCNDSEAIASFKETVLNGLPDGAPKGTTLEFACGGGKVDVCINDKNVGCIKSKPLATGFAGIYTDNKAVCQLKSPSE
mmetsp:Transcript_14390/g.18896  ORF Transcript_14390/g.18896 Transcript_14390/m.18896 type:complete len:167 (-) Transcript_14390:1323-1823(-)